MASGKHLGTFIKDGLQIPFFETEAALDLVRLLEKGFEEFRLSPGFAKSGQRYARHRTMPTHHKAATGHIAHWVRSVKRGCVWAHGRGASCPDRHGETALRELRGDEASLRFLKALGVPASRP